jgi:hypothetical protein
MPTKDRRDVDILYANLFHRAESCRGQSTRQRRRSGHDLV